MELIRCKRLNFGIAYGDRAPAGRCIGSPALSMPGANLKHDQRSDNQNPGERRHGRDVAAVDNWRDLSYFAIHSVISLL